MKRRLWTGILSAGAMLILILDTKTALRGGIEGIKICLLTVLPSLLPFFVLSILLTSVLTGAASGLLRPIGRLCRMPAGSEPLLLLGLLGGYPSGAQSVTQAYTQGQISQADARRLLGFCSNAGPAFLFGMASTAFEDPWIPWLLWGVHILSAILTGILLPGSSKLQTRIAPTDPITLPWALEKSIRIMAKVCGWIILFRVILAFCDRWFLWLFPAELQVLLCGILELANGCVQLGSIPDSSLRFIICAGTLGFGGISVLMQTVSVTAPLGLGMYLPGKLLHGSISVILAALIQKHPFPWLLLLPLICLYLAYFRHFHHKAENNSSISLLHGV